MLGKLLDFIFAPIYYLSIGIEKIYKIAKKNWLLVKILIGILLSILLFLNITNIQILFYSWKNDELINLFTALILFWTLYWIRLYTIETQKQNQLHKRQIDYLESNDSAHLITVKNSSGKPIITNIGGCAAHIGNLYISYYVNDKCMTNYHERSDFMLMPMYLNAKQSEKNFVVPFDWKYIEKELKSAKSVKCDVKLEYIDKLGDTNTTFEYDFMFDEKGEIFPIAKKNNRIFNFRGFLRD